RVVLCRLSLHVALPISIFQLSVLQLFSKLFARTFIEFLIARFIAIEVLLTFGIEAPLIISRLSNRRDKDFEDTFFYNFFCFFLYPFPHLSFYHINSDIGQVAN